MPRVILELQKEARLRIRRSAVEPSRVDSRGGDGQRALRAAAGAGALSLLVLVSVQAQTGSSVARSKDQQMANQIKVAARAMERFQKTKNVDYIERAVQALESADPPGSQPKRRELTEGWLHVLAAIDQESDPHFDPDDLPLGSVKPPSRGGIGSYPSGIDPKAIADPALRAEYEKALAKNQEKAEKYSYQRGLRLADSQATPDFEKVIHRDYTSSNADQTELRTLIQIAGISAVRKKALTEASQKAK